MKTLKLIFVGTFFMSITAHAQTPDLKETISAPAAEKKEAPEGLQNESQKNLESKSSSAATPQPKPTRQQILVEYGSAGWNKDPKQMDSAFLFMKDKKSKRVLKILLEETEPDSSTFSGKFSISTGDATNFQPQIFVPPVGMRLRDRDAQKFNSQINKGRVKRKPVVFRTNQEGQKRVDVYDTRTQAEEAVKAYREQQELSKQALLEKTKMRQNIADESTLATAKLMEKQQALTELASLAAARASDRLRLEQIEKQRADARLQAQNRLAESEKKKRRKKAEELAARALQKYQAGDYPAAESLFKKSVDLDPENSSFFLKYGITLYRNQKYNEALVTMKLAKGTESEEIEKAYFMGLTYYRLKELESAQASFALVKAQGNDTLAPSAAFYSGLIHFSLEKFKPAKEEFEFVLDRSKDPRMDEKAEEYIEKIIRLESYRKNQAKRFVVNGTTGLMYDSNVIYAPDNQTSQGTQTDKDALRLMGSVNGDLRFINNDTHELSFMAAGSTTLSLADDLGGLHKELGLADPYVMNLSLPYIYKTTLQKKGYRLSLKPGYEKLNLDTDNSGSAENIQNSLFLNIDNTFIMSGIWFSTYSIHIRSDDSLLTSSTGDSDADAVKVKISTAQTYFLDDKKKKALIGNFGLTNNGAKGKERTFNRIDLGVIYMAPAWTNGTWNAGLSLYYLDYNRSSTGRTDNNKSLSLGLSKPANDWLSWGLNGNYVLNESSDASSDYTKYTVMTTASFKFGW